MVFILVRREFLEVLFLLGSSCSINVFRSPRATRDRQTAAHLLEKLANRTHHALGTWFTLVLRLTMRGLFVLVSASVGI